MKIDVRLEVIFGNAADLSNSAAPDSSTAEPAPSLEAQALQKLDLLFRRIAA
jgi:hypothetical protein